MHDGVFDHQQVLGKVLNERQETALCIVPGVRSELLLVRSEAVHHARYTKLKVTTHTVHRPAHRQAPTSPGLLLYLYSSKTLQKTSTSLDYSYSSRGQRLKVPVWRSV